jgi:tRNA (cytidine56-2'-O)-methyltransferase
LGDCTISVLAIGKSAYATSLDLCLTSRALGAAEITFIGKKDNRLVRQVNDLNKKWGGKFKVQFAKNYKDFLKSTTKYKKIYLTRYGLPLQEKSYTIKTYTNIVLIVALMDKNEINSIYKFSDFNISVSSQPHCAAAAIAIFLHEFYNGRELAMHFENAKYKLVPNGNLMEAKELEN